MIVCILYLIWLVIDVSWTRIGLMVSNVVLFISAVLMVVGGDYVMIIDIFLSIYFGFETYMYWAAYNQ